MDELFNEENSELMDELIKKQKRFSWIIVLIAIILAACITFMVV